MDGILKTFMLNAVQLIKEKKIENIRANIPF